MLDEQKLLAGGSKFLKSRSEPYGTEWRLSIIGKTFLITSACVPALSFSLMKFVKSSVVNRDGDKDSLDTIGNGTDAELEQSPRDDMESLRYVLLSIRRQ